jgi:hypothetical protein
MKQDGAVANWFAWVFQQGKCLRAGAFSGVRISDFLTASTV